ncbi:MAG: hypothetical protein LUH10_12375 [Tannerellaceae bacterium]|nr:hypothetical protein [Tannerellaceae bacterium]
MKNVLVIYYSQTGQLEEIVQKLTQPFQEGYSLTYTKLVCDQFKFPLTFRGFFEVFPESMLQIPCEFRVDIPSKEYDIIVLGFQPWFVNLSIPINSLLGDPGFLSLVKGKQVILVQDSRNTWRNSLHQAKTRLEEAGATVCSSFTFRDVNKNLSSLFSLFGWLFKGNKHYFKRLPVAGIDPIHIEHASLLGTEAIHSLNSGYRDFIIPEAGSEFTSLEYEQFALKKYEKWAHYITKNNNKYRKFRLTRFIAWVLFTIVFVAPFVGKKSQSTPQCPKEGGERSK